MRILLSAIYPYAFLLLYLTIPFDNYVRVLPNLLLVILAVVFPFVIKKEHFNKIKKIPLLLLGLLAVYLFANALFSGSLEADFKYINKVLLSVALVVLYIPIGDFKKLNRAIVFSSLAAIIFTAINFLVVAGAAGNFSLGDSPRLVEALLIDRLYLGMLSLFSIWVSYTSIKVEYSPYNGYNLFNIAINSIFIVLIASNIALVILLLMAVTILYYKVRKTGKIIILAAFFTVIFSTLYVFQQKAVLHPSYSQNSEASGFLENTNTWDIRTIAWHCANKISNKTGFTFSGIGFSNTKNALVSCYDQDITDAEKRELFIKQRYNTHNQFIDFYLGAGFWALLLFLSFLTIIFFKIRNHGFAVALLLVLIAYCMVEDMFQRQIGAYYVGFIFIMLLKESTQEENHTEIRD